VSVERAEAAAAPGLPWPGLQPWLLPAARGALAGRATWPQALLLYGPRGVGKHALALHLARALLCESLVQEGDPGMARSHFVALSFTAETLDWLWLGRRDLRRARFQWFGHDWMGHWIVP
jgi:DNA polymerase III delta prime subunit